MQIIFFYRIPQSFIKHEFDKAGLEKFIKEVSAFEREAEEVYKIVFDGHKYTLRFL